MIKFFLGIAIIAFTSYCGRLLAKKYRQRQQFFKQFQAFNERFLNEISYYRRPLKEFIYVYSYQGEFALLLKDFCLFLQENSSIHCIFEDKERYFFLKAEERQMIEDYFFMLGKGDSASQKGYFSSLKDTLVKLENETKIEAKRYGDLYLKIGFLFGLLVLILIV